MVWPPEEGSSPARKDSDQSNGNSWRAATIDPPMQVERPASFEIDCQAQSNSADLSGSYIEKYWPEKTPEEVL